MKPIRYVTTLDKGLLDWFGKFPYLTPATLSELTGRPVRSLNRRLKAFTEYHILARKPLPIGLTNGYIYWRTDKPLTMRNGNLIEPNAHYNDEKGNTPLPHENDIEKIHLVSLKKLPPGIRLWWTQIDTKDHISVPRSSNMYSLRFENELGFNPDAIFSLTNYVDFVACYAEERERSNAKGHRPVNPKARATNEPNTESSTRRKVRAFLAYDSKRYKTKWPWMTTLKQTWTFESDEEVTNFCEMVAKFAPTNKILATTLSARLKDPYGTIFRTPADYKQGKHYSLLGEVTNIKPVPSS